MSALVARLLIILTVLVAPLTMAGHSTAMAAPTAADPHRPATGGRAMASAASHRDIAMVPDHCAGAQDEGSGDGSDRSFDCTIACAALPAMPVQIVEIARLPVLPAPSRPLTERAGLHPEAATPPPRFS